MTGELDTNSDPGTMTGGADPEPPWRRLSPGMLLVEPIREIIRFVPMLLILLIAGARSDGGPPWGLIGTALVVALGIARYLSTRYRITPAVVEVRRGIVQRTHLTVPRNRIRTLDVSAHPLQRLLRLVRVDIGTGSSHAHAASVRLDGLPAASVPALRSALLHRPSTSPDHPAVPSASADAHPPAEVELSRLDRRWIALAPTTLSGVVTGAVLIGFGFRLLHEARVNPADFGPVESILGFLRGQSVWLDVALAAAAVVIGVSVLSVVGYVISYSGFRLTRHPGGTLQVTRGLLTTRSTTLAEHRLRGVQRREPIVLRWAGGARLHAVATGLRRSGDEGDGGGSSLLMPPAPRAEVLRVESAVLGLTSGDPGLVDTPLNRHGPAARRRRYTRALAASVPLTVGLAALTWWAGLPIPLLPLWGVLVLAAFPLAADRYRNLGHTVRNGHLVVRVGSLYRRRTVLAVDGVVGVTLRRSPFQRRAGLATLVVATAAGAQHYDVPDLSLRSALDLAHRLIPEWPVDATG